MRTAGLPDRRITHIYQAALAAVDPRTAVQRALTRGDGTPSLDGLDPGSFARVQVVSVGKAAHAMAAGLYDMLDSIIQDGFVLTKDGLPHQECPPHFQCFVASHPVPDERGVAATRYILRSVRELRRGDLLIALISGGGSALLESPIPPVTLDDLQATTRLLLRAGAPINDLNQVRSVLSEVKGGGLRRAAGDAVVVSFILSDVLGNDPRVIASGPTIPAVPDYGKAATVLRRYGLMDAVPATVRETVARGARNPVDQIDPEGDQWRIVADNRTLVDAAEAAARELGLRTHVLWRDKEGEAADLAREFVAACEAMPDNVDVVLGGGEATVTVRGTGVGGRNTEFALAAALELEQAHTTWHVASLASDGDDAETGAAGAIASAATIERARSHGIDPERELADNNSARVFAVAGGLVTPGPTGTNVNDLYIAIRG